MRELERQGWKGFAEHLKSLNFPAGVYYSTSNMRCKEPHSLPGKKKDRPANDVILEWL